MARILIVDDSPDFSESLAQLFQTAGHVVTRASNGREALWSVLQQVPDVILMDLSMPEMDGAAFLEVVRSYLRIQSIPAVVLTGNPDSPMIDRVRALKVKHVLIKGTATVDEIICAVEAACVRAPG